MNLLEARAAVMPAYNPSFLASCGSSVNIPELKATKFMSYSDGQFHGSRRQPYDGFWLRREDAV